MALDALPTWQDEDLLVVVETPRGSRVKLAYAPKWGTFVVKRILPAGMIFPYDFGFVPGTIAEDGDPLDVLVLIDGAVPSGSVVMTRLVGVIEAEQREGDGAWARNDRLLGIASCADAQRSITDLRDLDRGLLAEIEAFFVQYHRVHGREFRPIHRRGSAVARALVGASVRARAAT
ncbi:MAG: inorganic diphosphatase [Candidatus Limnocylindrales bacterium]